MLDAAAPDPASLARQKQRLLEIIKEKSVLRGQFKLASGAISDYYLDLRRTTFDAVGGALVGEIVYSMLLDHQDVRAIGGLELGAVPIVIAVCARSASQRPIEGFVVRKASKDHGTGNKIDGNFTPGSTVVLVEDVTTKGGSVMQAVRAVREQGATIKKIITIVDREEGAKANLEKEGLALEPIYTARELLG